MHVLQFLIHYVHQFYRPFFLRDFLFLELGHRIENLIVAQVSLDEGVLFESLLHPRPLSSLLVLHQLRARLPIGFSFVQSISYCLHLWRQRVPALA